MPVEEHAELEPKHAPKHSAALRTKDRPPVNQLLGLQRLAGNQAVLALLGRTTPGPNERLAAPVQRLMVRMPNPYGQGMHNMVGEAEVDEMREALSAKGAAGTGGEHKWEGSWVFPPTPTAEASVFYGHGNRAKLGGVTPVDFVLDVAEDKRQLKKDTAFKFVACGGGRDQAAATAAGAAYGAEVAAYLRVTQAQGENWGGALKATEGLVYYTNTYKTVLPEIPAAIDKLLQQRTSAAESSVRGKVTDKVRARLEAIDQTKRATDFTEFRDVVATFYASDVNLASRASSVRAIKIPSTGRMSNTWLRGKLNSAMDTMFGGNVGWLDVQLAFMRTLSSDNCLGEVWEIFADLENDMKREAKTIWEEFRTKLQSTAKIPARSSGPGSKLGTLDPLAAQQGTGPDERFTKWQNFGDVLWSQWKANRFQSGGNQTI